VWEVQDLWVDVAPDGEELRIHRVRLDDEGDPLSGEWERVQESALPGAVRTGALARVREAYEEAAADSDGEDSVSLGWRVVVVQPARPGGAPLRKLRRAARRPATSRALELTTLALLRRGRPARECFVDLLVRPRPLPSGPETTVSVAETGEAFLEGLAGEASDGSGARVFVEVLGEAPTARPVVVLSNPSGEIDAALLRGLAGQGRRGGAYAGFLSWSAGAPREGLGTWGDLRGALLEGREPRSLEDMLARDEVAAAILVDLARRLEEDGWTPAGEALPARTALLLALLGSGDPGGYPQLREALLDAFPEVRAHLAAAEAMNTLGAGRDPELAATRADLLERLHAREPTSAERSYRSLRRELAAKAQVDAPEESSGEDDGRARRQRVFTLLVGRLLHQGGEPRRDAEAALAGASGEERRRLAGELRATFALRRVAARGARGIAEVLGAEKKHALATGVEARLEAQWRRLVTRVRELGLGEDLLPDSLEDACSRRGRPAFVAAPRKGTPRLVGGEPGRASPAPESRGRRGQGP
jgi:hypothetical protein